jgi:AcrR family transcriptional regulator
MTVFWSHGYEGASMAELTAAMGLSAPSVYAAFGNKEGLFRAVLDRYEARRIAFMNSVLTGATAYDVAERYLTGVAEFVATADGRNPPGCLLLQSGLSCGDTTIPDELARHRAEKEAALRQRFEQAQRDGDTTAGDDPTALARFLMVVANGIAVQAAAGATADELKDVAKTALHGWPGSP